jgi:hypothetical protein
VIKARISSNPIGTLCTVAEKCMPHVRDPLSLDTEADAGFFSPVRSSWRTSVVTCLCGLCPMRQGSPGRRLSRCRERIFPSRGDQSRCPDPKQIGGRRRSRRRVDSMTGLHGTAPESFYDRAERVREPDRRIRANDHAASALPLPVSKAPSVVAERRCHAPVHRPKAHGLNETQS